MRFSFDGRKKTEYGRLCEKHNDMSYNRKFEEVYPGQVPRHMDTDFTAVEITSDADWDATRPAGSSLADITMFHSVSPKKYIDSGYKDKFDWKKGDYYPLIEKYFGGYQSGSIAQGKNGYHPFSKPVSQLKPEDMVLL